VRNAVIGQFDVPSYKVVHVPIKDKYKNISQVYVRGGHPWGAYCNASNKGATIISLKIKPSIIH
jgi:hypothetical protein